MSTAGQRIEVQGDIRIGRQLALVRRDPDHASRAGTIVAPLAPADLRPKMPSLDPGASGPFAEKRYTYVLEAMARTGDAAEVAICNLGLCQSYGIFGSPGCGKTYLLMHLLRQVVAHARDDGGRKFGGLILDPKAALYEDVLELFRAAGREKDLVIINESLMKREGRQANVIDCFLEPYDLGMCLAMAARSAGISSKEPFWLNELGTITGSGLSVLRIMQGRYRGRPTLALLVEMLLGEDRVKSQLKPKLETVLADASNHLDSVSPEERGDFEYARTTLQRYLASKDKATLASFLAQAYGQFGRRDYALFSEPIPPDAVTPSLYDATIEEGKFILVSVSKRSMAISRILCTLVKSIFQQTVLTRLDRHQDGTLANYTRPLLFMADEYSDVATEVPGQPFGDALFFSQMRQFGCMGLVATQSVQMLKSALEQDTWKAIFGNMAAKIFMQLADPGTAEEAGKLVGDSELLFQAYNQTWSGDGLSLQVNNDLRDRKADLPTKVLLQTLARGQAVIVGSLDGRSRPGTWFVEVDAQG